MLTHRRHARMCMGLISCVMCLVCVASGCSRDTPRQDLLTIFAASSLTDVFKDLSDAFGKAYPNLAIRLNTAGSQTLSVQIENGARASVFASANREHAERLSKRGLMTRPAFFARNEIVLIYNKSRLTAFRDPMDVALIERLVVGLPASPIGAYTKAIFERFGRHYGRQFLHEWTRRVVSREANVRVLRSKVEMGEADAAFVYLTDAIGRDSLAVYKLPQAYSTAVEATISARINDTIANQFMAFTQSSEGQAIIKSHGFSVREHQ